MYPCCTSPLPRSAPSSPLVLLLLLLLLLLCCLFRGMWLAGCVRWPDSKSLTHSLYKFPFFIPGSAHLQWLHQAEGSVYSSHTLFDPTVSAERICPLPFYVSSQASPCSDLFQCFVASRVCVRLRPCPVKYRLFKEVSSIIWPLYCNYKVLLLEMAHRESCPQALAESVSKS